MTRRDVRPAGLVQDAVCAPLPAPAPSPPNNRGGAQASLDASHHRAPPGICPSDPVQVFTVHPPSGDCWDGAMDG